MATRTCRVVTGAQSGLSLLILLGLHVPGVRLSAWQSDATPAPIVGPGPSMPEEVYVPHPPGVRVEVVATNLDVVWSLEFAPDGRLFLTEKAGRIRVIGPDGRLDPVPWRALERVHSWGEAGLMGMALHPDFPREPWVYVMSTTLKDGRPVNRVARIREASGRGAREEVLLDDIPAAERTNHNGGRIRFGPDGMLWIGTGDAYEPGRAQDLSSPSGGVLRLTPAGDVPADTHGPGTHAGLTACETSRRSPGTRRPARSSQATTARRVNGEAQASPIATRSTSSSAAATMAGHSRWVRRAPTGSRTRSWRSSPPRHRPTSFSTPRA